MKNNLEIKRLYEISRAEKLLAAIGRPVYVKKGPCVGCGIECGTLFCGGCFTRFDAVKAQNFLNTMEQMCSVGDCAEEMTNEQLFEHLCSSAGFNGDVRSLDQGVLGEVWYRWSNPLTWRIRSWWAKRKKA